MTQKKYIYGMGIIGIRTYMTLKEKGFLIEGFIDSDEKKQGTRFEGKECISLDQYRTIDNKSQIIIAVEKYEGVASYLQQNEIHNFVVYKDIPEIFEIKYEPICEIGSLERIYKDICHKLDIGDEQE